MFTWIWRLQRVACRRGGRGSGWFPRLLVMVLAVLGAASSAQGEGAADYKRTEDLVYGRKFGMALTLDVFEPPKKNGYGVIMIVSGGYFSSKEGVNPGFAQPFLARGYTVFGVVHGSQPRFIIPEITADLHRAVRWIRHESARWGVKPDQLAAFGASAGGHLSLTLATQGSPGKPDAKDPVDRESSEVKAIACFFPPVDFANWGAPGEDACGVGRLKDFQPAFGPRSETAESRAAYSREISPYYFVSGKTAPSLIIHGDADQLVPLYQAQLFEKKAKEAGAICKVIVREGGLHGWPGIGKDLEIFADWFDEHVRELKKP